MVYRKITFPVTLNYLSTVIFWPLIINELPYKKLVHYRNYPFPDPCWNLAWFICDFYPATSPFFALYAHQYASRDTKQNRPNLHARWTVDAKTLCIRTTSPSEARGRGGASAAANLVAEVDLLERCTRIFWTRPNWATNICSVWCCGGNLYVATYGHCLLG